MDKVNKVSNHLAFFWLGLSLPTAGGANKLTGIFLALFL